MDESGIQIFKLESLNDICKKYSMSIRIFITGGTFDKEYNELNGVHGYDSSDLDKYDSLRLNERLIIRAICDAEDNDNGQKILEGSGSLGEKKCTVKLFTSRT